MKAAALKRTPVAVIIADPHWSTLTPEYRRERTPFQDVTAAKLAIVGNVARQLGVPVLICGDLCDRSREFMDYWTLRHFLHEEFGKRRVIVRLVRGQHDMFHHNDGDDATTFNAILNDAELDFRILDEKPVALCMVNDIIVYGCGWGEPIPKPFHRDANNVLVIHKTMWHTTPVYPGQTDGNVGAMAVRLHELGYKVVFSGDNHKAFDVRVGGVDFHNVGALTRRDVTLANQRPRYIVLYSDLTTESFYVGNDDVFDLGRSDADKTRDGDKDEFSAALAGGFSYDETFKGNLELAAKTGRVGDAELTEPQRRLLRDIINAI